MNPTIYLALTHDWELRGNGSGDIEAIQFAPMRELLRIYKDAGVRTTFCPDLMQQLTFRELGRQHPELNSFADRWDEHVCEAFRQGHDIQLHLHPQWRGATFKDGKWKLTSDWSILNYDEKVAAEMIGAGKLYLENLLRPIDPEYKCVAFRAGALAIAPSPHLLSVLIRLGFKLDVSLAGDLYFDTRNLHLDYRNCEESALPFYPELSDARKVSRKREEITCVPIQHFYGSRKETLRQHLKLAKRKLSSASTNNATANDYAQAEWGQKGRSSVTARIRDKLIEPYLSGRYLQADTAQLSTSLLREMMKSIRSKVKLAQTESVPVVLTNHPKDIQDFAPIERFVREANKESDVRFITLTELVQGFETQKFSVRTKQV